MFSNVSIIESAASYRTECQVSKVSVSNVFDLPVVAKSQDSFPSLVSQPFKCPQGIGLHGRLPRKFYKMESEPRAEIEFRTGEGQNSECAAE